MTDFVNDNTDLPTDKADVPGKSLGVAVQNKIRASEWNATAQAAKDLRSALLSGKYHGLADDATVGVSPAAAVRTRSRAGVFEVSENGAAFKAFKTVYNVRSFGAKGDGTTDDYAAFAACIAAMPSGQNGVTMFVPAGTYRLGTTLAVNKNIILEGEGSNSEGGATTVLLFDQSVAGLVITGQAVVQTITIKGPNTWLSWAGATNTHGIEVRAGGVNLQNVFVLGFNGNGVYQNGSGGLIADFFVWNSVRVQECAKNGFYLADYDANAGTSLGCSAIDCGEWGLRDNSFLGNTHIGMHVSTCASGPYRTEQVTASNLLLNCYDESGMNGSLLQRGTLRIGGIAGSGYQAGTAHNMVNHSGIANGGTCAVISAPVGDTTLLESMALGSFDPNVGACFTIVTRAAPNQRQYFGNRPPAGFIAQGLGGSEWFSWNQGGDTTHGWMLSTYGAITPGTAGHQKRYVGGSKVLMNSFLLGCGEDGGVGNGTIRVMALDAAPAAGTYHRGDRVYDALPVSGGAEGWVCTDSGTYGTYTEGRTVTSAGSTSLTVSGGGSLVLEVGDRLLINGVTDVFITGVSNLKNYGAAPVTTLTVSANVPAGAGLSIAYVPPTFKTFGVIA